MGQPDVSSQKVDQEFANWLNTCLNKSLLLHNRKTPIFKLWHIDGSLESYSEKQALMTFYELDSPTGQEVNVLRNNAALIVTNKYTQKILEDYGVKANHVPLGFDKYNFETKTKNYFSDGRIVFNILGKFEKRKHHEKAIKAWIRKYGNNPKYFLQCAIYNPFFKPEDNEVVRKQLLNGRNYFNVQFLPFMQQNEIYNDFLNSANIVIAMSGAEGWGLGEFHSVALGKYCVGLYAHAHKDWMTDKNSVLINPASKIEAYDGMFFVKGRHVNQGNIFDWNEDEFIAGCEKAISLYSKNPINEEGLKLQNEFTYSKTLDSILNIVGQL